MNMKITRAVALVWFVSTSLIYNLTYIPFANIYSTSKGFEMRNFVYVIVTRIYLEETF